jgi:hypothetical protein
MRPGPVQPDPHTGRPDRPPYRRRVSSAKGPVTLTLLRWVLSPRTSWRARRLMRGHGDGGLSFDTAWRRARVQSHPDEFPYRNAGHGPPGPR